MLPAPPALRLVSRAKLHASPPAPFGLRQWSDDAAAIAIMLDPTLGGSYACDQTPDGATLAPSTLVVILANGPPASSLLARIFRPASRSIPRVVRATALLARGFVGIGAGVDPASGMDLVWGYSPS